MRNKCPCASAVCVIALCSRSVHDTHAIAGVLAGLARPSDVIILAGDMGAGKTAFAVGFAQHLGVSDDEMVASPTFTLVHSHDSGRLPLLHADVYRLNHVGEVSDLGLLEQADMGRVVLVEWGNVVADVLGDVLTVELMPLDDDENARNVLITSTGQTWATRWKQLERELTAWDELAC